MTSREDLLNSNLLSGLTAEMIEKVLPLVSILKFEAQDSVFTMGDTSELVYLVKSGKVLLEQNISDMMTVTVDTIKPGKSFGWAAVLSDGVHCLDAVCSEPSEIYAIDARALKDLFKADHSMGYLVLQKVSEMVKQRLDRRTEQLVRALATHPDIHDLEEE